MLLGMLAPDESWKWAQVKTQGPLELEEGDKSRRRWVWILQRCPMNKSDWYTAKLQTCPSVSWSSLGWLCHQAGTRPPVAAPSEVPCTPNPLFWVREAAVSTSDGSKQANRIKHCFGSSGHTARCAEMGMKASLRVSPRVPVSCDGRL